MEYNENAECNIIEGRTFPSKTDASYSRSEQRLYTLYLPCIEG